MARPEILQHQWKISWWSLLMNIYGGGLWWSLIVVPSDEILWWRPMMESLSEIFQRNVIVEAYG